MVVRMTMTAIILAGGKSSRMGRDKALLKFGEKTMLENLVEVISPLFDETLVIVDNKTKVEGLDLDKARVCEDKIKNRGPMAGIYTGLCLSKTRASCVFTCDMPFIDQFLIEELLGFWEENYDGVCLEDAEGKLQPFPGIYAKACRHLMRLLLDKELRSMRQFFEVAVIKPLVLKREKIEVLTNMNTIEDYYRVLRQKEEEVRE